MAYLTVYNRSAPWKRLVINLNILRYTDPRFKGDEGWMLYAKADEAVTSAGEEVPMEIIGSKTRTIKFSFGSGWSIAP